MARKRIVHEYYRFPRGHLYYYRNPRSGFSSTLEAIGALAVEERVLPAESVSSIQAVRPHFRVRDGDVPQDALTYTIVRNPYRRLMSVYAYGIRLKRFFKDGYRDYPYYERFGFGPDTRFADFVRAVVTTPPAEADDYVGPQVHRIFDDGRKRARYIARLETIRDDWSLLTRIYGTAMPFPRRNESPAAEPIRWTEEIRALAYDYYRDDFTAFGYERESIEIDAADGSSPISVTPMSRHLDPQCLSEYAEQIKVDNAEVRAEAPPAAP